jgi:glucan phosphoethanolaminetransferase (alkaline phosphatase superfamily)
MGDEGAQHAAGPDRGVVSRWLRELVRSLAAAPTSPSAYAFWVVLLATVLAKSYAARSMASGRPFLFEAFGACAADLLVYPLLSLLLVSGERTRRWLAYLTYPLSLLAVVVALINAAYVAIANDQIDARVLVVGLNRFDEVADIALLEALRRAGHIGAYALVSLPLGFVLLRLAWRRTGVSVAELGTLRIHGLCYASLLGGVCFVVARVAALPYTLAAELIADNALVHTYVTWLDDVFAPVETNASAIEQHFAPPMVAAGALASLRAGPRRDLLVLVLESTRFDHVELPVAGHVSSARTPGLLSLAQRGTFFTNAHASMPHTSKSLVSMLCGRLPAMENPVLEAADGVLRGCLPELLQRAGYATAFLQSAVGSFEYRPRLTTRLGYERFDAFETIEAPPLGYLAGDDRALLPAFARWLAGLANDEPFFATLLTSGTHHPYQIPADVTLPDASNDRARYAALVELEDRVLAALIDTLARAGRLENTLILAVADHGEGLHGDAVRQHDNNFFEESLHVPLILAGPGVPAARNDALTSLLDVAPIVLGALGIESALPSEELRFGSDRLGAGRRREYAPFACWNDGMCEGVVGRDVKLVRLLADHRSVAFDRGASSDETKFRRPSTTETALLARLARELASTHLSALPGVTAEPLTLSSGFVCGRGAKQCRHPSRPRGGFHAPPEQAH